MNGVSRAIFGLVVVSAMVLGAFVANQAIAGGGKRVQYVPFPVPGQAAPPTAFDLLLLNQQQPVD